MTKPWIQEIWRILAIIVFGVVFGAVLGHFALWWLLGVLSYLAWHIINIARLQRWLGNGLKGEAPFSNSVWEEIFLQLFRMQQRHLRQRVRLANQLSRFQEASEALPEATVILDHNGRIEWFNKVATRLLGLRSPQDIHQNLLNLVRHPELFRFMTKNDYSEPVIFPSPVSENIILSVIVVPYGSDQRLFMARDVTHLQRLENMRRDFVANVSHEMRTPLTVIGGYLETLKDMDDECIRLWGQSLDQMQQQTTRMGNLVNDLLLLSRLESSESSAPQYVVNVPALVESIKEEAMILSGDRQHKICVEQDVNLFLKGEQQELHSAFSNLVSNAVRYTPTKGEIIIRWYSDKSGAHLEVQDSGIGIAPKHVPRLTERFYRVDVARSRHNGGTGLGLAIVKHVLERHQAELVVKSEPGQGSLFRCNFPEERIVTKSIKQALQ